MLPTGDREWFSQDAEARVTEEMRRDGIYLRNSSAPPEMVLLKF